MNRAAAIDLLDRLHAAQNEMYAGGPAAAVEALLTDGVAVIGGAERRWLLPLDAGAFDAIWA